MSARDPKVNPRAGDTLGIKIKCIDCLRFHVRTVLSVEPRPYGMWIQYKTRSTIRICQLSEWQRWAARTEVLPPETLWIILTKTVRGDGPFASNVAIQDLYPAQVNQWGAVSVIGSRGLLGVKPGEFEWVLKPYTSTM